MAAGDIAGHESIQAQRSVSALTSGQTQQPMPIPAESAATHQADFPEIGRRSDDLPAALSRTQPQRVRVDLYTEELVAEMMHGVTYEYWTFNSKVPGPFIRVRVGDQVEIHLSQGKQRTCPAGALSVDWSASVGQYLMLGIKACSTLMFLRCLSLTSTKPRIGNMSGTFRNALAGRLIQEIYKGKFLVIGIVFIKLGVSLTNLGLWK